MNSLFILLSFVLLRLRVVSNTDHDIYTIDVKDGENKNLTYYLCGDGRKNLTQNVKIKINNNTNLKPCVVRDIEELYIEGVNHSVSIACSCLDQLEGDSFSFVNISNLTICNIYFLGCAQKISPKDIQFMNDTGRFPNQTAYLIVNECHTVSLHGLTFVLNDGFALVIGNTHNFTLGSSIFEYASSSSKSFNIATGALLIIMIPSNNISPFVEITDSVFKYNVSENDILGQDCYHLAYCLDKLTSSGAGGISIIANGTNISQMTIKLTNVKIVNTGGTIAGGLLYYFFGIPQTLSIIMSNVLLQENTIIPYMSKMENEREQTATRKCCGKGITGLFEYLQVNKNSCSNIDIQMIQCNITNNLDMASSYSSIPLSPAISIQAYTCSKESFQNQGHNFSLRIKDCHFNVNKGISPVTVMYVNNVLKNMLKVEVIFTDITVDNNMQEVQLPMDTKSAIMTFINVDVTITGTDNKFHNNGGSVICLKSSHLYLNGDVCFFNNQAYNGAALYVDSDSLVKFNISNTIIFRNNTAGKYGGAIYVEEKENIRSFNSDQQQCVFNIINSGNHDACVYFNNTAKHAGNSIWYMSFYDNCNYTSLLNYINSSEIYARPTKMELYNSSNYCKFKDNHEIISPYSVRGHCLFYPGATIQIPVTVKNKKNDLVPAKINGYLKVYVNESSIYNPTKWVIPESERYQIFNGKQHALLNYTIFIHGDKNYSDEHLLFLVIGNRFFATINVSSVNCPSGFHLDNSSGKCVCCPSLDKFGIKCNISNKTMILPAGSWAGMDSTNGLFVYSSQCPSGFCKQQDINNITVCNKSSSNEEEPSRYSSLCTGHRTGVLCGECIQGHSIVFGYSRNCEKCHKSNLWIIPIWLAIGLIFILIVFTLDFTVADGTVNALVLGANILLTLRILQMDSYLHCKSGFVCFMRNLFASIFTQTYIMPHYICILKDLSISQWSISLFIYPLYLWSIILTIIIISRWSSRVSQAISHTSVQVLCTIILFTYPQFLNLITIISVPAILHTSSGNPPQYWVWYFDGSVRYNSTKHVALLVTGIFTTFFFLLPFTILGLFGSNLIQYHFINKYFKNFIDAIHGPYRTNKGYWFGLQLLVMLSFSAIYTGLPFNAQEFLYIVLLALYLMMHTACRPYKRKVLNYLTSWLVFLLIIEVILLATIKSPGKISKHLHNYAHILTNVLISLTYICAIIIVFLRRLRNCPCSHTIYQRVHFWGNILMTKWNRKYKNTTRQPSTVHSRYGSINRDNSNDVSLRESILEIVNN